MARPRGASGAELAAGGTSAGCRLPCSHNAGIDVASIIKWRLENECESGKGSIAVAEALRMDDLFDLSL